MKIFTQAITFGTPAVQITLADTVPLCNTTLTNVSYVYVEAVAGNSAVAYVGVVGLTSSSGVISTIGIPDTTSTGARLPFWELKLENNRIDLGKLWFQGTSGQGINVTFVIED